MCLTPVRIRSKAKDFFNSPYKTMVVNCGKCIECLQDKQRAWEYRLFSECKHSKHSLFVTLTYDVANLPLMVNGQIETYSQYVKRKSIEDCCPTLNPRDLQLYFKRLRKKTGVKLKFFACGEYGSKDGRPHYHFALFYNNGDPAKIEAAIDSCWQKGFTDIQPLIEQRIIYLTKYITDKCLFSKRDPRAIDYFNRCSKGLGIDGYFEDEKHYGVGFTTTMLPNGTVIPVPRYYKRKFLPKTDFYSLSIYEQYEHFTKRRDTAIKRFEQDRKILGCGQSHEANAEYARNRTSDESRRRVLEQVKRAKNDF